MTLSVEGGGKGEGGGGSTGVETQPFDVKDRIISGSPEYK